MSDDSGPGERAPRHAVSPEEVVDSAAQEECSAVESAFARYIDRLLAGEMITLADIRREHPEMDVEMLEQLRLFCDLGDDPGETIRPQRIGDFEIIREVGRGGMGIVCEAVQISLGRRVALKIVPAGMAADAKTIARFVREAQLSAKLDHPNVVTVYEMGIDQHVPYYAMEFVEGETLASRLKRLKVENTQDSNSEFQTRRFYFDMAAAFVGAADGLHHAHNRGIVHRDLKPSNLIFDGHKDNTADELLRILDFGLAQVEGQESLTASGDFVGSVRYMSPEQASVARGLAIDHRTDIYSLGATLYEALTLQPPFQGKDIQDTLLQIQSKEVQPAKRINPRIPVDLETIATKCLRKDPGDRYGSAEALSQDLKRFLRGDIIEARPPSTFERTTHWMRQHVGELAVASCFMLLVVVAAMSWARMLVESHRASVLAYPVQVRESSDILRSVHSSAQAHTGIDLYLVPAGYSYVEIRNWISLDANQEQVEKAISMLSDATRSVPTRSDAYWHRARAHLLNQNVDDARVDLNKLLEIDPKHVPGRLLLADVHRLLGESERSKEIRAHAVALADQTGYQDWWRAQQLAKRLQHQEAADSFEAALEANLDRPPYIGWEREVKLSIAICRCRSEEYVLAMKHLHEDSDDNRLQLAIAYYGEGSDIAIAEADRILGELKKSAGEHVAVVAVRQYQRLYSRGKISELDWDFIEGWIKKIERPALQSRMRALCLAVSGQPKAGVAEAEAAIEMAPYDPEGYYFLAESLLGTHDVNNPRILELLDKSIELAPENLEYRACRIYNVARCGEAASIPEVLETLEDLESRAMQDPRFWPLLYLGITHGEVARYCHQQDIDGRLADANRLLDMAKNLQRNSWLERNRGYMYRRLASSAESPEQKQEYLGLAIKAYKTVLDTYPYVQSFQSVYRTLAQTYKDHDGDNKRAIEALLTGWESIPEGRRKDPLIAHSLWTMYRDSDPEEALAWLTRAIEIDWHKQKYHVEARTLLEDHDADLSQGIYALKLSLERLLRQPKVVGKGQLRILATLTVACDIEGSTGKAREYASLICKRIDTHDSKLSREWEIARRILAMK